MDALRQIFHDYCPASGALLTCPACINLSAQSPGAFSLIRCEHDELIPGRIRDGFRQMVISHHGLNIQLLKEDCAIHTNKRMAELMSEVVTPKPDSLMGACCCFGFLLSLCLRQSLFVRAKESRIINLLACRECAERRQANIYPDASFTGRERLNLYFNREARIPLARGRARDRQSFNFAFNRAMQFDFDISNFRQAQFAASDGEAGLGIGETVVSLTRAKAREASLTCALFYTAKERLKGFVKASQYILQHLAVNLIQFWAYLFDFGKLVSLLNIADRFTLKLVGIPALLQACVIEFSAKPERGVQACRLRLAWKESELESSLCYSFVSHVSRAYLAFRIGESRNIVRRAVPARSHFSTACSTHLKEFASCT